MHSAILLDLDGTIAPVGKSMTARNIELIRKLEDLGYRICLCSGKPTYYLCGFARQLGLDSPVLIGENGAAFQLGVDLPPVDFGQFDYSEKAAEQLDYIRKVLDSELDEGEVWYQPNSVAITPFHRKQETFDKIGVILKREAVHTTELTIYPQSDCYDILPKGIDKGTGAKHISELLDIPRDRWIAVGDGINDVPMFDFADVSIVIGNKLRYDSSLRFDSIEEALEYIVEKKL